MEKLILWIFVCEVFEVEILLALCSPQTFWQLTVSNHWSNKTYGYNAFALKKSMTVFQSSCWPHFDILNTYYFLQWILTCVGYQEWLVKSVTRTEHCSALSVIQWAFLSVHPSDRSQALSELIRSLWPLSELPLSDTWDAAFPTNFWKLDLALWVTVIQGQILTIFVKPHSILSLVFKHWHLNWYFSMCEPTLKLWQICELFQDLQYGPLWYFKPIG